MSSVTMSKVSAALSLLLIILTTCDAQVQPDCVTPDNRLGACVDTRYCVSIMTALVNNDHLTNPTIAKFLRESQCGLKINSQKVCCSVDNVDFGGEPAHENSAPTASHRPLTPPPPPPTASPSHHANTPSSRNEQQPTESENCGRVGEQEELFKWIGELWFKHNRLGRVVFEAMCLGVVISSRHVVVPAHCIAALPGNVSFSHLLIDNEEYPASKIFVHAAYNQPRFANDIAIIELAMELSDDKNRSPADKGTSEAHSAVCLDVSQANAPRPSIAIMKSEESAFNYGRITFLTNDQCSPSLQYQSEPVTLTTGQFCAKIQWNNGAVYSSFIGAVILQYDTAARQYSLRGFTSASIRTEQAFDEAKPFVFTDVEQQLVWIKSTIARVESDSRKLDGARSCQLPNENGRCVPVEHCTLYRDAPQPLSRQQELFLEQIKCSTDLHSNHIESDDGICCPEKYVNQAAAHDNFGAERLEIDERFRARRGASLLNMTRCGKVDASRRIVGGEQADLREFPWHALMKYKVGRIFKYTCAGSLISERYALTCAHCITQLPVGYSVVAVRLGEYDLTANPDCKFDEQGERDCNPPVQDIEIERLIPHLSYNSPRYSNDIGLVRMARNVEINRSVIPICLPVNDQMLQVLSNRFTVTGFGLTENGRDSDTLLKILVPKVPRETCQSFHRSVIQLTEGHTCYGGEGIIDSCKGDSGGPLLNYATIDGRLKAVQMGIVASGHSECGRGVEGFPGIYTDVSFYMDWILDHLEE